MTWILDGEGAEDGGGGADAGGADDKGSATETGGEADAGQQEFSEGWKSAAAEEKPAEGTRDRDPDPDDDDPPDDDDDNAGKSAGKSARKDAKDGAGDDDGSRKDDDKPKDGEADAGAKDGAGDESDADRIKKLEQQNADLEKQLKEARDGGGQQQQRQRQRGEDGTRDGAGAGAGDGDEEVKLSDAVEEKLTKLAETDPELADVQREIALDQARGLAELKKSSAQSAETAGHNQIKMHLPDVDPKAIDAILAGEDEDWAEYLLGLPVREYDKIIKEENPRAVAEFMGAYFKTRAGGAKIGRADEEEGGDDDKGKQAGADDDKETEAERKEREERLKAGRGTRSRRPSQTRQPDGPEQEGSFSSGWQLQAREEREMNRRHQDRDAAGRFI